MGGTCVVCSEKIEDWKTLCNKHYAEMKDKSNQASAPKQSTKIDSALMEECLMEGIKITEKVFPQLVGKTVNAGELISVFAIEKEIGISLFIQAQRRK